MKTTRDMDDVETAEDVERVKPPEVPTALIIGLVVIALIVLLIVGCCCAFVCAVIGKTCCFCGELCRCAKSCSCRKDGRPEATLNATEDFRMNELPPSE